MKKRAYVLLGSCLMLQAAPRVAAQSFTGRADLSSRAEVVSVPLYYHDQAKELLGVKNVVDLGPKAEDDHNMAMALFIHKRTHDLLPEAARDESATVAQSIIMTANTYHMDPLLLMAVISHESKFNPNSVGHHGEIGLMQIKPSTALYLIERKLVPTPQDVSYESVREELYNPTLNILYGTAYLASLRDSFRQRGPLYLAAYNMGSGNLRTLLKSGGRPRVYSDRVLNRYVSFALDFANAEKVTATARLAFQMRNLVARLDL